MRRGRRSRSLSLLIALAMLGAPLVAQDSPQRKLARWLDYLRGAPYHERAFEGLVEAALASDGLGAVLGALEGDDEDATRVLRARLHARTGKLELAVEELAAVRAPTARTHALLGELLARAERWEKSLIALEQAVETAESQDLLERIHRARAAARYALRDGPGAALALGDLVALSPADSLVALNAARQLVEWRLYAAAVELFHVAEERAAVDASRRCEALYERGRVHELLAEPEAALEAWERALYLVGRGHWLEAPLRARILAAHERAGDLEALAAQRAAELEREPHDLRARELLAEVVEARGGIEAALAVLEPAVAENPGDRPLAAARRRLFALAGDTDGEIAELQRLIAHHPRDAELRLELGRAFLLAGRFDAAEREWRRGLEGRGEDSTLLRELAASWSDAGEPARAAVLLEEAVAREPRESTHYGALAELHARQGDGDALEAVLELAERNAGDDPAALDGVARLRRRHRHLDEAVRLLRRADELEADVTHRLRELAEVLSEHGARHERAEVLHRLIAVEHDAGERARAAASLVRGLRSTREVGERMALERERLEAGESLVASNWVLAKLHERAADARAAAGCYERLIELDPTDLGARIELAKLFVAMHEDQRALDAYRELVLLAPERAREYRRQQVPLLMKLARIGEARAVLRELVDEAADGANTLREAADWSLRLGLADDARDYLLRAARIDPSDSGTRLWLAEMWTAEGQHDAARRELRAAHRYGDEEHRERAIERLSELDSAPELARQLAALWSAIEADPAAAESARLAVDLALELELTEEARAALGRALTRSPFDPFLSRARARLLTRIGDHDGAIAAFEALQRDLDRDPEETLYEYLEASLQAGDIPRARKLAQRAKRRVRAARFFVDHGRPDLARELLTGVPPRAAQRIPALELIAQLAEEEGELEAAADALAEHAALIGDSSPALRKLGRLYSALGRDEEALALGRRLLELEEEGPGLEAYFTELGLLSEYTRLRAERILRHPDDELGVQAFFEQLLSEATEEPIALELVDALRSKLRGKGEHPATHTARSWALYLDQVEIDFFGVRPTLARERLVELNAKLERDGGLREIEWNHVLRHSRLRGGIRERERELYARALAQHPNSPSLRFTAAHRHGTAQEHAQAAEHYLAIVRSNREPEAREEQRLERERARREWSAELRRHLHESAPELELDAQPFLSRAVALTRRVTRSRDLESWVELPAPLALRQAALSLAYAGRHAEACALIESLGPRDPDRLPVSVFQLKAFIDAGYDARAKESLGELLQRHRKLACDPGLGGWHGWLGPSRAQLGFVANHLLEEGDAVGAAELLRRSGAVGPALRLVVERDLFELARQSLKPRIAALERRLAAGEIGDAELELRDLALYLAELFEARGQVTDARETCARLSATLPADPLPHRALASILERAGELEAAVTERRIGLELERVRRRDMLEGACDSSILRVRPFEHMEAVRDALTTQRNAPLDRRWQYMLESSEADADEAFVSDALALARLSFALGRPQGLDAALAPLREEAVQAASFDAALFELLASQPPASLGEYGIRALQLVCQAPGAVLQTLEGYVNALLESSAFQEARDAIAAFVAARDELSPMEHKRLGILRAAVDAAERAGQ